MRIHTIVISTVLVVLPLQVAVGSPVHVQKRDWKHPDGFYNTRMTVAEPAAFFTDVTSGPLAYSGFSLGAAWGDYDNDDDLDLYLANSNWESSKLFRNEGGGSFTDVTSGPLQGTGASQAVAWADYDNDGDLDLYVTSYDESNKLLRNDHGTFVDATNGPLGIGHRSQCVAWGDYDRDGDLDMYVTLVDGPGGFSNRLLRNEGGIAFSDATTDPLAMVGYSSGVAWGDYDNDGDLDLYVANDGEANVLFRNDDGAFEDATNGPLGDTNRGHGVAWGDYDNDGDLDLYLANYYAPNKLFRNDGGGVFVDATTGDLGDPGPGTGVAWVDYDNDGGLDLFVTNDGAANRLLHNDGNGVFTDVDCGPLGDAVRSFGMTWGDYDRDGDVDVYLTSIDDGNRLLRNDQAAENHWLQVKLVGTTSNRDGIGTRVRLVAGGVSRIQEIAGGSGLYSENELVAHFGLGAATTIDSLFVYWPTGFVQRVLPVPPADTRIAVVESPVLDVEVGADLPPECRLLVEGPNPTGSGSRILLELPVGAPVSLAIFDPGGRLVRSLESTRFIQAGRHEAIWDARDTYGSPVPSGIYFLRLVAGTWRDSKRLVIIRP